MKKKWQQNSHHLWLRQTNIHEQIESEVGELQWKVEWLWDQIINMQKQMSWDITGILTSFCIIPAKFIQQNYTWEQVKYLLQDLQGMLWDDKIWLASEGSDLVNRCHYLMTWPLTKAACIKSRSSPWPLAFSPFLALQPSTLLWFSKIFLRSGSVNLDLSSPQNYKKWVSLWNTQPTVFL